MKTRHFQAQDVLVTSFQKISFQQLAAAVSFLKLIQPEEGFEFVTQFRGVQGAALQLLRIGLAMCPITAPKDVSKLVTKTDLDEKEDTQGLYLDSCRQTVIYLAVLLRA